MIKIYNEDCFVTMNNFIKDDIKCDIILTSPPYNTSRKKYIDHRYNKEILRYSDFVESKTKDEYCNWCIELFENFDKILNENGIILWNSSYGSDITHTKNGIDLLWLSISDIIRNTNFTVADKIVWKKKNAMPNNASSNKLTRIVEDIFVFCRKNEYKTFICNKEISSISKQNQKFYKPIYNYFEASNNDGSCSLNKATFSSDMCKKLLKIYAHENCIVYDPFMGTGTTGVSCKELNLKCYGSEISKEQCDYAYKRLNKININDFI